MNNLRALEGQETGRNWFKALGLSENYRAEELTADEWLSLYETVKREQSPSLG